MDIAELVQKAKSLGLSKHTINAYERVWRKFVIIINANNLDTTALGAKLDWVYEKLTYNLGASGHLQTKAALSLFYTRGTNPFIDCKAPKFDIDKIEIEYLEGVQIAQLLKQLETSQSYFGKLSACLANCLFFTAKRFHEWSELPKSKLSADLSTARMKVKGGRFIDVPLPARISESLKDWLLYSEAYKGLRVMRGDVDFAASDLLFPGRMGGVITNQSFNLRLHKACTKLGVAQISAHGLRHSAATLLLNKKGANLREVQNILGHKNLSTTARYTHIDTSRIKILVDQLGEAI